MQKKIGIIFTGGWAIYSFAKAEKYRNIYQLLYVYDLAWDQLEDLEALVIPFLTNQHEVAAQQEHLYRFLKAGKKIFVEGDSSSAWLNASWEDRPTNNYWWVSNPDKPPIARTNFNHPVYQGLTARHSCWHTHGAYTKIPQHAEVLQTAENGEIISWQTTEYGGTLFVTTLDPFVEHGIRQITHLDNYVDKLTAWLCGQTPQGEFSFQPEDYGKENLTEILQ